MLVFSLVAIAGVALALSRGSIIDAKKSNELFNLNVLTTQSERWGVEKETFPFATDYAGRAGA